MPENNIKNDGWHFRNLKIEGQTYINCNKPKISKWTTLTNEKHGSEWNLRWSK